MPSRADMLAVLDQFRAKGLTPVLATVIEGVASPSVPDADVVVTRGPRVRGQDAAPILNVQITAVGQARLDKAGA